MNDEQMQKYEGFRNYLCAKYDRKCLTRKCPLAKFGCYEFFSFSMLYRHTVNGRSVLIRAANAAMKSEGYNPQEGM